MQRERGTGIHTHTKTHIHTHTQTKERKWVMRTGGVVESDMSPSRGASQGAGCRRAYRCGWPCVTGVRSEAGLATKGG